MLPRMDICICIRRIRSLLSPDPLGVYSDQVSVGDKQQPGSILLQISMHLNASSWKYSPPYLNALHSPAQWCTIRICPLRELKIFHIQMKIVNLCFNFMSTLRHSDFVLWYPNTFPMWKKQQEEYMERQLHNGFLSDRRRVGDDLSRDCQLGEERLRCQDCFACSTHSTSETDGNA